MGQKPWSAIKSFEELFDSENPLSGFAPKWKPLIIQLCDYTPEQLIEMDGTFFPTMSVVRAEKESKSRFVEVVQKVMRKLEKFAKTDRVRWGKAVEFIMEWNANRRPESEHVEVEKVAMDACDDPQDYEEVRNMFRTGADALREEGKLEGKRSAVSRGIQLRFPQHTASPIVEQIQKEQNLQFLDQCLDALLVQASWDDFAKMCEKAHLN